jgi:hypothetical protein
MDDKDDMIDKISSMIPESIPLFRIHESGDFFDQRYLDAWIDVVKSRPNTYFFTYTRNFPLNYSKILKNKNFTLWASTDDYNIKEAKQFIKKYKKARVRHAFGPWNRVRQIPANSFICPATNHKLAMEGACERCKLCVVGTKTHKHVVFLEH